MRIDETKYRSIRVGLFAVACLVFATAVSAQTPSPSPGDRDFNFSSSIEIGVRGLSVNGDHEKFRSDLNYRAGVRLFDSSLFMEDSRVGRTFDSLLLQASGWGADPSGSFRLNMEKAGAYRFDSNVRRVHYFNDLKNHAVTWSQLVPTGSQHKFDTEHNFGDFDLTVFPESNFRLRFGVSFNDTSGPGAYNIRFTEEFQVNSRIETDSLEFRVGGEGKLLGFNVGLNYGRRKFHDDTRFFDTNFNQGNDPASAYLNSANRQFGVEGVTDWGQLFVQRTFAHKFDFTGRLIYSHLRSDFTEIDLLSGRVSPTGNFILSDDISVFGRAKRPQTRADVGMTYRAVNWFRISNTFTFDQFNVWGDNDFYEIQRRTLPNGSPTSDNITSTTAWRFTDYQKFSNLTEADFQVNRQFAFNLGYRYTHRTATPGAAFDFNRITNAPASSTRAGEEFSNATHTFIAGTRIKPTTNWSIFADLERGQSDSVFTRIANNDYFNFRVRSIASMKKFTFNVSYVSKDSESPGSSTGAVGEPPVFVVPEFNSAANNTIRIFSTSIDWTPRPDLSISGGYNYHFQNGVADIVVPVASPVFSATTWFVGTSEYFVRDSYYFIDVSARPSNRVSFYGSYRFNDDKGQGNRIVTRPQDFITSYPMRSHTPEFRVAFKLHRNVDWNIGYQYNSYRETPFNNPFASTNTSTVVPQIIPAQNYKAHMPYTSLRFYFGRSGDR